MTDTENPGKTRERPVPPAMTEAWESATAAPDPLEALAATRTLSALLSEWQAHLAAEATAAGATWEVVGGAIGTSRQAAWERFHHDVREFRDLVVQEANDLGARHRQEVREFRQRVKERAKQVGRR